MDQQPVTAVYKEKIYGERARLNIAVICLGLLSFYEAHSRYPHDDGLSAMLALVFTGLTFAFVNLGAWFEINESQIATHYLFRTKTILLGPTTRAFVGRTNGPRQGVKYNDVVLGRTKPLIKHPSYLLVGTDKPCVVIEYLGFVYVLITKDPSKVADLINRKQ